jgi:hypothetical protein
MSSRYGVFMDYLLIPVFVVSFVSAFAIGQGYIPFFALFACGVLGGCQMAGRVWVELDLNDSLLTFSNGLYVWKLPFSEVESMGWDRLEGSVSFGPHVLSVSSGGRRMTILATTISPFGLRARKEFMGVAKQHFQWVAKMEPTRVWVSVFTRQTKLTHPPNRPPRHR